MSRCWLTAEHPVKVSGQWLLPKQICKPVIRDASDRLVYNLMIQMGSGHSVLVDGLECVTLGHGECSFLSLKLLTCCRTGLKQGPLAHQLWGSAIRPFLHTHPQYPRIVFRPNEFSSYNVLAAQAMASTSIVADAEVGGCA